MQVMDKQLIVEKKEQFEQPLSSHSIFENYLINSVKKLIFNFVFCESFVCNLLFILHFTYIFNT